MLPAYPERPVSYPFSALVRKPFNRDEAITRYKRLIRSLPRANQYLLLYVLDLLSVFARKSDKNLMTAKSKSAPCSSSAAYANYQTSVRPQISR